MGAFIQADRQTIAFDAKQSHTLDVSILDTLAAPGATLDPDALEWASGRCDRELLAGLSLREAPLFESWLLVEREHRQQQLLRVAHQALDQHLWNGRLNEGIDLARRLLQVDPWQESVHRQMMRLLARSGQLTSALEHYRRCRQELVGALGIEPQPEMVALYEQLRAEPQPPRTNLPAFGRRIEQHHQER